MSTRKKENESSLLWDCFTNWSKLEKIDETKNQQLKAEQKTPLTLMFDHRWPVIKVASTVAAIANKTI